MPTYPLFKKGVREILNHLDTKLKKVNCEVLSSEDFEIKTRKPKILCFDIETTPLLAYTFQTYEASLLEITEDWYMLCFSALWVGGKQVTKGLPDYGGYKSGKDNEKKLVGDLWKLLDECQVVVAHNGRKFDLRKAKAKFIEYGMPPPSPYKVVDTLITARREAAFSSNKLDELGKLLGVGRKVKTGGIELWFQCMRGDLAAWTKMKRYCAQDTRLLQSVYLKLLPWMQTHPNVSILAGIEDGCRNCGSTDLQKRGFGISSLGKAQRYQCKKCATWCSGPYQKATSIR